MTVDEFVQTRVAPEFRPVATAVRRLMREVAPRAQETISYGMPVYAIKKPMAWINAGKTGISLGFREGAYFDDRYGLLKGAGKHAKNVRLKTVADVSRPAIRY